MREKEGHFVCVCLQVRMSVEEIERSHLQIFIKDTISVLKKFGLRLEQAWMLSIGNEVRPTFRHMVKWTTCPKGTYDPKCVSALCILYIMFITL